MSLDLSPYHQKTPLIQFSSRFNSPRRNFVNSSFTQPHTLDNSQVAAIKKKGHAVTLSHDSSVFSIDHHTRHTLDTQSLLHSQYRKQAIEQSLTLINNRVNMLEKEEEKMLRVIRETRQRAQKLSEIRDRSEQDYLRKVEQQEITNRRREMLREMAARKREESEKAREEMEKQKFIKKEKLNFQKIKYSSEVRSMYRQYQEEEMAYKQQLILKVQQHHMESKLKLEKFAIMQENTRKQFYDSRVSLNQSVIVEKSNQILHGVQRESALLERLKNTQSIHASVGQQLSQILSQTKRPVKERMNAQSIMISRDQGLKLNPSSLTNLNEYENKEGQLKKQRAKKRYRQRHLANLQTQQLYLFIQQLVQCN